MIFDGNIVTIFGWLVFAVLLHDKRRLHVMDIFMRFKLNDFMDTLKFTL